MGLKVYIVIGNIFLLSNLKKIIIMWTSNYEERSSESIPDPISYCIDWFHEFHTESHKF